MKNVTVFSIAACTGILCTLACDNTHGHGSEQSEPRETMPEGGPMPITEPDAEGGAPEHPSESPSTDAARSSCYSWRYQ